MPTLNLTISVPTQAEVDDFCTATGYKSGVKADFVKTTVANYIKNTIKSYRVSQARQTADVTIKQVSTSADGLIIQ